MRKPFPLAFIALASCGLPTQLPLQTKGATVCIYQVLKSRPEITALTVYSVEGRKSTFPLIDYLYSGKATELSVGRSDTGFDVIVEDGSIIPFMEGDLAANLKDKCGASWGYADQVMVSPPPRLHRERVDMSEIAK